MSLFHIFRLYFKTNFIIPALTFNFVTTFFSLFLAAIFIEKGFSESEISLYYILVFLIPVLVIKTSRNDDRQVFWLGVASLIPISIAAIMNGGSELYALLLSIISGLAITSRDQIMQFFQQALVDSSLHFKVSFQRLSSASVFVMILLSLAFSFAFSFAINSPILFWPTLFVMWLIAFATFRRTSTQQIPSNDRLSSQEFSDGSNLPIPASVTAQCLYTTLMGASYYIGKLFLMPYMIIDASKRFGFENYSFTLIVAVIGLVSIIGILGRSSISRVDINNIKLMKYGYRTDLTLWLVLFMAGYYVSISDSNHPLPYLIVLLCFTGIEISSKFWTVGFFGVLKDQVDFYDRKSAHPKRYQSYMAQYSIFKSMGGAAGFTWVYLTSSSLSLYLSAASLALIALVYDFAVSRSKLPVIGKKTNAGSVN